MNGHDGLSTDRHRVNMAFSIEEAPCGSTGFFTMRYGLYILVDTTVFLLTRGRAMLSCNPIVQEGEHQN
jgi:hypothetical protein